VQDFTGGDGFFLRDNVIQTRETKASSERVGRLHHHSSNTTKLSDDCYIQTKMKHTTLSVIINTSKQTLQGGATHKNCTI